MSKSFENYDKVTAKDKAAVAARAFGLGFIGALIGCVLPVVLLCMFDIASAPMYAFAGCGAMVFYGVFLPEDERRWYDHISLIVSASLATFMAQFFTHVAYYSALWSLEGTEMNAFQKATYVFFSKPAFNKITSEGIISDSGSLSVYTIYLISLVFVIIGMYIAYLFVLASDKEEKKKKNKKA